MPKVFIISHSGHDYSPAEQHGELVFISRGPIGKFNTGTMYRAAKRALANSTPEDFILLSGPGILSSIVCALFASKHGKLNILLYCGTDNRYIVRRIAFDEDRKKHVEMSQL